MDELKNIDLKGHVRILFKTVNSKLVSNSNFSKDYIYLTPEAAEYLLLNNVKLVGIDYFSINRFGTMQIIHKKLLGNNVIIIEGLNLSDIATGEYELIALPLKLHTDSSPARVILRKINSV